MAWERSGVPGGLARTSWFDRDVPAMWRLLENQQSDDHWRLVAGWRKASELTVLHLRRLEQYRANLTEVWPPDRNTAAAAYVARLDFLIQNVRATYDVAAANYSTLAATVGALASARRDLKPLYDEYLATSRAIKEYDDLAALNRAAEGPTVIGAAPAGAADLERLNNRARALMYTLSHTLVEAEAAIRQPPAYPSDAITAPVNPDVYGRNAPTDRPPASRSPLPPSASIDTIDEVGSRSIARADHQVPGSDAASGIPSRATGDTAAIRPVLSPSLTGLGPTRPPQPLGANFAGQSETIKSIGGPLAPGGVIGAMLPTDRLPPAQPTKRINPVGGVIGGQGAGNIASGHTNGYLPAYGFSSPPKEEQQRRINRRSPETTWDVVEGGPSVIAPSRDVVRFDPGPAIGLER